MDRAGLSMGEQDIPVMQRRPQRGVYRVSTCHGQPAGLWPEPGQEAGRGCPQRDMLEWEAAAQDQGWARRGLGGVMCSLPASAKARLESQMAVPPGVPWAACAHCRQGNVS